MPFRQPAPRLINTVQFSAPEIAFLNSIKPWEKKHWTADFGTPAENKAIRDIKDEIINQLTPIQNNYCAFCGLNLSLAHKIHREHIAPQYKHPDYIFEPKNLVLSCNFCNEYKMKKRTVIAPYTGTYGTEQFMILHPHRDDYSTRLSCDFSKNELVFKIIDPDSGKTQATIECVGLAAPHLMSQRGAIILKEAMPKSVVLDLLVKAIIKLRRIRK